MTSNSKANLLLYEGDVEAVEELFRLAINYNRFSLELWEKVSDSIPLISHFFFLNDYVSPLPFTIRSSIG